VSLVAWLDGNSRFFAYFHQRRLPSFSYKEYEACYNYLSTSVDVLGEPMVAVATQILANMCCGADELLLLGCRRAEGIPVVRCFSGHLFGTHFRWVVASSKDCWRIPEAWVVVAVATSVVRTIELILVRVRVKAFHFCGLPWASERRGCCF
jgi:hypothetical protein